MDDQPIVSIITPTYNHGRYIGKCIESVLSQTFNSWEMIIIDDASLDDTEYVVKKFKNKRIRYISRLINFYRKIWSQLFPNLVGSVFLFKVIMQNGK
jgi:glycosyltransferase involved in cell wall biosynthesis